MGSVVMNAHAFTSLCAGIVPFASTDRSVPAMCNVECELTGAVLVARATDRYRAMTATVKTYNESRCKPGERVAIPAAWLKRVGTDVRKAVGKDMESNVILSWDVEPALVTLQWDGGTSSTMYDLDVQLPGIEKLLDRFEPSATEHVSFNPDFLADLAAMPHVIRRSGRSGGAVIPVRFTFSGESRGALIELDMSDSDGVTWRGLLMPVRLT